MKIEIHSQNRYPPAVDTHSTNKTRIVGDYCNRFWLLSRLGNFFLEFASCTSAAATCHAAKASLGKDIKTVY